MIDMHNWLVILLIFIRMTAFLASAPFFSIRGGPPLAKGALGLILAILLFPVVGESPLNLEGGFLAFSLLIIQETFVGLILGYTTSLVFSAIRMAGQLIDLQIGLVMTGILDPHSGEQRTTMGQFLYVLGILLFLLMDYHHVLLRSLAKSFEVLPLGGVQWEGNGAYLLIEIFSGTFALALKMAAPILAVLIIIDVSLGLVARTVPQLNVFMLGFPMKIGLGILMLSIVAPLLASAFSHVFQILERDFLLVLRSLYD